MNLLNLEAALYHYVLKYISFIATYLLAFVVSYNVKIVIMNNN